jgi:hypothetical protein
MSDAAMKYMMAREGAGGIAAAGERLAQAMSALHAFDLANPNPAPETRKQREALVRAGSQRLYAYVVTREAAGVYHHHDAISFYRVPPEVVARMGAD